MGNSISTTFSQRSGPNSFKTKERTASFPSRILGMFLFILSLVGTIFLTLALASFSGMDPGFSMSNSFPRISNLLGLPGSWVADLLYLLFGWSAWLLVAAAVFTLIRSARTFFGGISDYKYPSSLRLLAFFVLMLSSCTLFFLRLHSFSGDLPGTSGGAVGSALGTELLNLVGLNLSTLISAFVLLVCFSTFFNFSWLRLMETIGGGLENFFSRFKKVKEQKEDEEKGEEQRKLREERLSINRENSSSNPDGYDDTVVIKRKTPVPLNLNKTEVHVKPLSSEPIIIKHEEEVPVIKAQPEQVTLEFEEPPHTDDQIQVTEQEDVYPDQDFVLPELSLLDEPPFDRPQVSEEEVQVTSERIEHILGTYKIKAKVLSAMRGPVITRFKVQPGVGVQSSRFVKLSKDLARGLGQQSIRVIENLREVDCLGLEVPNPPGAIQMIYLKEIIGSNTFNVSKSRLTLALGKNVQGDPITIDLGKAPHLLVAGTTGSGKSVGVNAMILSMLYKNTPDELKLILIDPKEVEFAPYDSIPHLLTPVITDMMQAAHALDWAVREMDKRYKLMKAVGVRNFESFNEKIDKAKEEGSAIFNPFSLTPDCPEPLKKLHYIVIIIDELADLLMTNGKQVEFSIIRLTQKARAAGMHLILATQRPSTDIVTPIIKTNCPSRVSFQVSNRFDSQTILGEAGAEELLGRGDMFYMNPSMPLQRVHGANVSDKEIERVTDFIKAQREPEYVDGVTEAPEEDIPEETVAAKPPGGEEDPFYDQAVEIVVNGGKASISFLQRKLGVGYNRAAKLMEAMEEAGIVSAPTGTGKRTILRNGS